MSRLAWLQAAVDSFAPLAAAGTWTGTAGGPYTKKHVPPDQQHFYFDFV